MNDIKKDAKEKNAGYRLKPENASFCAVTSENMLFSFLKNNPNPYNNFMLSFLEMLIAKR
jgi:hypothetical protein